MMQFRARQMTKILCHLRVRRQKKESSGKDIEKSQLKSMMKKPGAQKRQNKSSGAVNRASDRWFFRSFFPREN